ncbi:MULTISPECIES: Hsp20/alpha crystallin family protein [unclassified Nitrobacter]|uniref:Hsp20/alpha crystallin family protein n=1 Tax=unclassified Nitrobacter TaxID=2620411 RepID=UPI0002DCC7DF|nr:MULTISPECIES: Hsp20/alpha crystallin family protein [unclassified Nitrobacter]MCB1393367.1 Hsp20/alpha crystallin family protein [Nitrobacter sp.]MCV0385854.1 Hsp20/alpha crystallin family protein [Nitrobacter sp.]
MMKSPLIPVGRDSSLTRTEANPLALFQQEMDRLIDGFSRSFTGLTSRALMPSMDLAETDKEIELTAELPGMEEKDVQLNVVDNHLTIRGEKKNQREEKEKDYHLVERSYGSFVRTVDLPPGVNIDSIKAVMSKGVLKVTVPKPAPAQTKTIEVKTAA